MSKKQEPKEGERKREQKIVYIDDGSTVADMSGTRRGNGQRKKSTAREKVRTYFSVVKRMILPMLCTLLAFTVVFLIVLAAAGRL